MTALARWVHAAQHLPEEDRQRLLLRGSLLTAALVDRPRSPVDVDYLVTGDFDPGWVTSLVADVGSRLGPAREVAYEPLWVGTPFPGLRARLTLDLDGDAEILRVDFAFGDPMTCRPERRTVAGVAGVVSCAAEDLWGWKLHGLTEFGRGQWRGKDLYDLARLGELPLSSAALARAADSAFGSRGSSVVALSDFMVRDSWGQSRSGQRKWRSFQNRSGIQEDFLACRRLVRAQVASVWPGRQWTAPELLP